MGSGSGLKGEQQSGKKKALWPIRAWRVRLRSTTPSPSIPMPGPTLTASILHAESLAHTHTLEPTHGAVRCRPCTCGAKQRAWKRR